jgi:hypothetical protein
MNAVNLIPSDTRTRSDGLNVSPPTLALMGGLLVALIAAVLYVTAANTVSTRKSELAQVTAGVAGWTAAANSYASFVHLAEQRTQQLGDVRLLAASRFPWSNLLGQIGGVMPRQAALSSLQATSTPSTSGASVPSVQLSGCAASQSLVAQTMVHLRSIKDVTAVTLSSSTDSSTGSASSDASSSSSPQGSGGCPFPVTFQLSMTFAPTATAATPAAASAGSTTTAAPATGTTSTPVATQ